MQGCAPGYPPGLPSRGWTNRPQPARKRRSVVSSEVSATGILRLKTQRHDAVYAMGHLIAGRDHTAPDWQDPRLLGWSNLLATAVWPALDDATRTRYAAELEGFAVAYALNTDRNADLLTQVERVVVRLNTAGIEPLILKGAAHLVTGLWPTPGARLVSDIDLLIEADALDTAFSALEDLADAGPQDRGHPEIIALNKHMLPVIGAGGPAAVELHHSIYQGAAARLAPPTDLLDRAEPIWLGDGRARVLSPTDRVLTAMLHGLAGSGTYLVPTLHMRDMLDIHFLAATYGQRIDWGWIERHLAANRWAVALEITNACLDRLTGMTPPFRRPGGLARLDAARWVRQMERQAQPARQVVMAANHLVYTLRGLRAGGEPRRRVLANLARPETYRFILRRYLLGQTE